jgi:Leucine-rich repeat (LRR) protein
MTGLQSIPANIWPSITHLYLSHNKIKEIDNLVVCKQLVIL